MPKSRIDAHFQNRLPILDGIDGTPRERRQGLLHQDYMHQVGEVLLRLVQYSVSRGAPFLLCEHGRILDVMAVQARRLLRHSLFCIPLYRVHARAWEHEKRLATRIFLTFFLWGGAWLFFGTIFFSIPTRS